MLRLRGFELCSRWVPLVFPEPPSHFAGTLKGYWRRFDVKDEALSIFLYFDSPTTRGKLLFPSLKQR